MKKNTKILVGVGIAVAAYLLYKTRTPLVKTTNTPKVCPNGTIEKPMPCDVAPCPTQCVSVEQERQQQLEEWQKMMSTISSRDHELAFKLSKKNKLYEKKY
jgi:hypothetical protein